MLSGQDEEIGVQCIHGGQVMKKICLGMGIMLIFLALPVSALIYAGGSQEALKLIFGAGAPSFPEPPEGDGFIASEREDWGKYFEFIRENDPDYYTDPVAFEDSALGDYVFMLSEWESKEALSYSGIYNRTDKLTELFSVTAEGYVEAYNKRVKEGTTYVTEDMKTVNLGFFVPFLSFKKAYVATFDAGKSAQEMTSALNSVISLMGDGSGASVTIPEENHFVASYESSYMNSDWEQVPSRVTIDCYYYPGVNGIAMYAKEYDRTTGELLESEMYEHRQLDENTFIFQNNMFRIIKIIIIELLLNNKSLI